MQFGFDWPNGFREDVWFVWVDALRPRSTAEIMSGRSVILSTLFLDKPPRGRLPVLSAHPFAIN